MGSEGKDRQIDQILESKIRVKDRQIYQTVQSKIRVKDRQIGQTEQSKIGVKEEYDQELDEIAMLNTEYAPIKIAPMQNETTGKSWEHAKWQC